MEIMKNSIIKACTLHFKGMIEKHKVNVENILINTVGVAEHPDIVETVEKELSIIAEYDDKLAALQKYFKED
tara:strand:- start:11497 stop:11712 length:216 start_codon:yes stop_codon:yes gene_type:complete